MNFSEALVHAHSDESNESALIQDVLHLVSVWGEIESSPNGSAAQLERIAEAREVVDSLRRTWNLSDDEIFELDEHVEEFRQLFGPPSGVIQQETG